MRRLLATVLLAAAATTAAPAAAGPGLPDGGQCDGTVDVMCRERPCGVDELDCGMIPPCFVWVLDGCVG